MFSKFFGDPNERELKKLEPIVTDINNKEEEYQKLSDDELKNAAQTIGKAEFDEKEGIRIYYQTYSPFELKYGYLSYGSLWYAFILRENGNEEEALSLIKAAAKGHFSNWRPRPCQYVD